MAVTGGARPTPGRARAGSETLIKGNMALLSAGPKGSAPSHGTATARHRRLTVDLSSVAFFVGVIMTFFGLAMIVPAMLDLADGNPDYRVMLLSSGMTVFAGTSAALAFRQGAYRLGVREVFLAVPMTWIAASAFGALPFAFSTFEMPYTDAVFETVSGLTATGSTVIIGLDLAPRGLLLWRFLLVWLGGFGVITFVVLVLPFLRIGGMQLFVIDLSAQSGKFVPRIIGVVARVGLVYMTLTASCATAYLLAGMSVFDAIGHAMAAIATGGFSSHDANIGYFKSPTIEWISVLFMALGAMPFVLLIQALRHGPRVLWNEGQVRMFLGILAVAVVAITIWRIEDGVALSQAFREATFNVVSIGSTTGFTSQDFATWGDFPSIVLLVLMLAGGCTGSTAGAVKAFRLCVLLEIVKLTVRRQVYPHITKPVTYNGAPINDLVRGSVANYFFIYIASFFIVTLVLAATGLSFVESLGASATALGGVGPSFGPNIGPCCTFVGISPLAKWTMIFAMLAGRLEILVFVIPLTRTFWRS